MPVGRPTRSSARMELLEMVAAGYEAITKEEDPVELSGLRNRVLNGQMHGVQGSIKEEIIQKIMELSSNEDQILDHQKEVARVEEETPIHTIKREPPDELDILEGPQPALYRRDRQRRSCTVEINYGPAAKKQKLKEAKKPRLCSIKLVDGCGRRDGIDYDLKPISQHELVCNSCLAAFANGSMKDEYLAWKIKWASRSINNPTVKQFVYDKILPYYLRCMGCDKFRTVSLEIPPTPAQVGSFRCGSLTDSHTCEDSADEVSESAFEIAWIQSMTIFPNLQNSPAYHFLRCYMYLDEIGMSPCTSDAPHTPWTQDSDLDDYSHPFVMEDGYTYTDKVDPMFKKCESLEALMAAPNGMEADEYLAFPIFSKEKRYYTTVRNLVLALWSLNPRKYLTFEDCEAHLLCRGASRVWYLRVLRMIYDFMNIKGVINYGCLELPAVPSTILQKKPSRIVIVGAGISGLCAARQLRSMGVDVVVLEAKGHIGGRMRDERTMASVVGRGAQIVTGVKNSPIILICKQKGLRYRPMHPSVCPLVDSATGEVLDPTVDAICEKTHNDAVDSVQTWGEGLPEKSTTDVPLLDRLLETCEALGWDKSNDLTERALFWHLGNSEYSCGASLNEVSARSWLQNEDHTQFGGDHAVLVDGAQRIVEELSEGTRVEFNAEISSVEICDNNNVQVTSSDGRTWEADKVLITVPLSVLQKGHITFKPPLNPKKQEALKKIGAGLIEKVAVEFPSRFWASLKGDRDHFPDFFGNVRSVDERNLFPMFYDFSPQDNPKRFVLMSYLLGPHADKVNRLSDAAIVKLFLKSLGELFPKTVIPKATGHFVSRWGADRHIGMSYSYVKVGGNGKHYEQLAASSFDKIFFAGEATSHCFPQAMNGAYLTGLREVSKMLMPSFRCDPFRTTSKAPTRVLAHKRKAPMPKRAPGTRKSKRNHK